jgi:hypothetical protein
MDDEAEDARQDAETLREFGRMKKQLQELRKLLDSKKST